MICDGAVSGEMVLISDLFSSAVFPGKVRLIICLFEIFLGIMFFIIESPINIIGESLVVVLLL